jgi:hypothetical protein
MIRIGFVMTGAALLLSCTEPQVEERPFGTIDEQDSSQVIVYEAALQEQKAGECPIRDVSINPLDSTFRISWKTAIGVDSSTTGHIVSEEQQGHSSWKLISDVDNAIYFLRKSSEDTSIWLLTGADMTDLAQISILLKVPSASQEDLTP